MKGAFCSTLQISSSVETSYAASLPKRPSLPGIGFHIRVAPVPPRPASRAISWPTISMQLWLSGATRRRRAGS